MEKWQRKWRDLLDMLYDDQVLSDIRLRIWWMIDLAGKISGVLYTTD